MEKNNVRVFKNPQKSSVYGWCVRYTDGEWSRTEHFKTKEEAEAFAESKQEA